MGFRRHSSLYISIFILGLLPTGALGSGKWFREIMLNSELAFQPKILNYHSERPHFLHGTLIYVPKSGKERCLGDMTKNCELMLITNAHGVNGELHNPELVLADVNEFIRHKAESEFGDSPPEERKKKTKQIKNEIEQELRRSLPGGLVFQEGNILAKIEQGQIVRDNLNDVAVIKMNHFSEPLRGFRLEHPRYTKWGEAVYVDVNGFVPEVGECIKGESCELDTGAPIGLEGPKMQLIPMSHSRRSGGSWSPSFLMSPLDNGKVIPFAAKERSRSREDQKEWRPRSSLASRRISFDARSARGNSGGLIFQYVNTLDKRMTGLLKGHNLYVNESTAVHPSHVYEAIEAARNNNTSNLNDCRGSKVAYKYDPASKSTYRELEGGLLSEQLPDELLASEMAENAGESGDDAGESGDDAGESGDDAGESGDDSGMVDSASFYASSCNKSGRLFNLGEIENLSAQVASIARPKAGLSYKGKPVLGFWMKRFGKDIPVFANSEFFNLYCESDIGFEPIVDLNMKKLFYQRLGFSTEDSIDKRLCFKSYEGKECLLLRKPAGSDIVRISLGDGSFEMNLANMAQANFQYWYGVKDSKNRVSHLIDVRQLFFVDAGAARAKGVNDDESESSVFFDSFSSEMKVPSDGKMKEALKNTYKQPPRLRISRVFEDNVNGRNSLFQRVLGDSPVDVSLEGEENGHE